MVIVGAGHAGGRAAAALRDNGWTGPITLIGAEPDAPYERPPLSKELLTGDKSAAECALHPLEFYAINDIRLIADTLVTEIHRSGKYVVLADGQTVGYEKLLLAPGAEPRRLDIPGADHEGVHVLRTTADAELLSARLSPGTRLTVIGAGLIGLEVASSAIKRGCTVNVVELADRAMARVAPEASAEHAVARHQAEGVTFHFNRSVAAFDGKAVHLDDGTEIASDLVLVSIGAAPRAKLAEQAGLTVSGGIVTDATLRTGDADIFVAGDACVFPHELFGGLLRLESWKNAEDSGPLAARNMLGANEPYRAVPWMWSDQYDFTIQVTGLPDRGTVAVDRPTDGALLQFHLDDDGRLVGASGMGPVGAIAKPIRFAQMLMERDAHPDAADLADPAVNLKALLKKQAA